MYRYTGKLYAPQESSPAKMIVRFPLSKISLHIFVLAMTLIMQMLLDLLVLP